MAKTRICTDCTHNNNGWCKAKKTNKGLRDLLSCELKVINKIGSSIQIEENNSIRMPDLVERHLGKREMFYNIQLQIIAINESDIDDNEKYEELLKTMKNLELNLQTEEIIYKVQDNLYSEIDRDIIESSKCISRIL